MFAPIEGLLVVQDRDRRILDLQSQLEKIPRDQARAESHLKDDHEAVARAHEAVQQCGIAIKNLELDIETRRNTISRLKTQQFETRKNDEYQALGHEVDRYQGEIDTLETSLLEKMEESDALATTEKEAKAALAKRQAVVDQEIASLKSREKNVHQEVEEVKQERVKLAADMDPNILDLYERLRVKKGGLAVVPIENAQCGGCHMRLIPNTLVKVQAANQVVQCENCGRILYGE